MSAYPPPPVAPALSESEQTHDTAVRIFWVGGTCRPAGAAHTFGGEDTPSRPYQSYQRWLPPPLLCRAQKGLASDATPLLPGVSGCIPSWSSVEGSSDNPPGRVVLSRRLGGESRPTATFCRGSPGAAFPLLVLSLRRRCLPAAAGPFPSLHVPRVPMCGPARTFRVPAVRHLSVRGKAPLPSFLRIDRRDAHSFRVRRVYTCQSDLRRHPICPHSFFRCLDLCSLRSTVVQSMPRRPTRSTSRRRGRVSDIALLPSPANQDLWVATEKCRARDRRDRWRRESGVAAALPACLPACQQQQPTLVLHKGKPRTSNGSKRGGRRPSEIPRRMLRLLMFVAQANLKPQPKANPGRCSQPGYASRPGPTRSQRVRSIPTLPADPKPPTDRQCK